MIISKAVLALWAADHAHLSFGIALIRVIQARRLHAPVADEPSFLLFRTDVLPSVLPFLRVQGPFREAVLALWVSQNLYIWAGAAFVEVDRTV